MKKKAPSKSIDPKKYGIQTDPAIVQLGETILRTHTTPVKEVADKEVRKVIKTLLKKVFETNGVGISANQIRSPLRICVVASHPNQRYPHAPKMDPIVMINPKIIKVTGDMVEDWEGCLSIPNIRGLVPRHPRIVVIYTTERGEHVQKEFDGFIERIVQHEVDHLHGILFLDRVTSSKKLFSYQEFKKQTAATRATQK